MNVTEWTGRARVAAVRGVLTLLAPALAATVLPATVRAAEAEASGPTSLLITYRSTPANRAAFRTYLNGPGRAPFEALKRDGAIADYQLLYNWYNDANTWDAMAIVTFRRYADVARWKELEKTSPGGLTREGLALASPTLTYSADLSWEGGSTATGDLGNRVFYVIPYEYKDLAQYRQYVDGYVVPQVTGWLKEGILSRYRIFLNRYPVGQPWDALFIYEYRNLDAFGQREPVIAKVRATLRDNATWQSLHAIKGDIRSETENVIADALVGN